MSSLFDRIREALQDRYLVLEELGQGAAAIVYLAEDRKHHRQVALKVLRPEVAADVGAERFIREIETVAQLSHPHILPLFDSGETDGLPWFVMPYMPGESLRAHLVREHQLSVDEALEITRDVACALGYAHSLGIVHRDIKPGNILLSGGRAIVADFGVARAISAAREGEVEQAGELFGTPLYMSPEQFTGSVRVDRRSDLYSLGCVLYEMLIGEPPFTGRTAEALRIQHITQAPPSLRDSQRNVEPEVVDVVERLLAKAPADRFVTAQQLVDALPSAPRTSGRVRHAPRPRRWRQWLGLAVSTAALVAVVSVVTARALNPAPDHGLYAVLSTDGQLAGQDSRLVAAVRAELGRWDDADLRATPELAVVDQVRARGAPRDLDELLAMARKLGAGSLLRLETRATGAGVNVALALYAPAGDARSTALLTESVACAAADAACDSTLALATRRLVVSGGRSLPPLLDPGTTSVKAYRALADGLHAYAGWDLPEAERLLFDAVRFDPGFADAHLNLAEVRWWLGRPPLEWRNEAAAALSASRTGAKRLRAQGLIALADRRFPDACEQFDSLIARNPDDFSAWFGRGECLRRDGVVVPDRRSPSGWRFRASRNAALASYERALTLAPGIHRGFGARAYQRTARLFPVNEYQLRPGYLEVNGQVQDSIAFAAWPDLVGDSVTFVPWPYWDITSGVERTRAANQFRAILRTRSRVAEITAAWVRSFPESPFAHLARAEALESLREGGQEGGWREVLHHAEEARRLAGADKVLQLTALATSVRLELKAERYAEAVVLADSALRAPVPVDTASARMLASVAALTGQIQRAVALTAEGARDFERASLDGQRLTFPTPLSEAGLALLTFAAFGGPADSIAALERRVEELTIGFVPSNQRLAARTALLARPAALAFPTMGLRPAHRSVDPRHEGLALQRLQAEGRLGELHQQLRAANRFGWRPSSTNVDAAFLAAWQFLAVGDTAEAIRAANSTLTSLAGYGHDLLSSEVEGSLPQMATLPRLMALRAELAALDGDSETTRRWARAVVTLWAGADPELQPTVTRMRGLLEAPR